MIIVIHVYKPVKHEFTCFSTMHYEINVKTALYNFILVVFLDTYYFILSYDFL